MMLKINFKKQSETFFKLKIFHYICMFFVRPAPYFNQHKKVAGNTIITY